MLTTTARDRVAALLERELATFAERHPRTRSLHERARKSLLDGVPMNWMVKWAGPYPLFLESATGAHATCADGHDYVDLCLGDTGAMAGHGAEPVIAAVERQLRRGITTMLPTEDAAWVGEELSRRFGLPAWQFTLTATDANRFSLRIARAITGRPFVAVHEYCYHGSVDETFAVLADDREHVVARRGNLGPAVDPSITTRVVPFNDLDALDRALADGQVAALLIEPALTNVGIVLPDPGYLEGVREITRRHGTILIHDETHTICAGPGGMTGAGGYTPDMLVIGKTIGGGGTLAGYALSMAAARAALGEVLTPASFELMLPLAERWERGVADAIARHKAPWSVTRLGARAEYHFTPDPPRDGADQIAHADPELERLLHLWVMNRGVLMTPFHNMALMSPVTTSTDVDRHTAAFDAALEAIFGA